MATTLNNPGEGLPYNTLGGDVRYIDKSGINCKFSKFGGNGIQITARKEDAENGFSILYIAGKNNKGVKESYQFEGIFQDRKISTSIEKQTSSENVEIYNQKTKEYAEGHSFDAWEKILQGFISKSVSTLEEIYKSDGNAELPKIRAENIHGRIVDVLGGVYDIKGFKSRA